MKLAAAAVAGVLTTTLTIPSPTGAPPAGDAGVRVARELRGVEGLARAYDAILQAAERLDCDLIVMASRGRSPMAGALLGSQTQHVIAGAKVPVLVV